MDTNVEAGKPLTTQPNIKALGCETDTVKHSDRGYVRGEVHANNIESL